MWPGTASTTNRPSHPPSRLPYLGQGAHRHTSLFVHVHGVVHRHVADIVPPGSDRSLDPAAGVRAGEEARVVAVQLTLQPAFRAQVADTGMIGVGLKEDGNLEEGGGGHTDWDWVRTPNDVSVFP